MSSAAPQTAPHPAALIVIPARLRSTRLPRKMLLRETGKTLIQHTYEAALRSRRAMGVCVATDAYEIFAEVRSFGGRVQMTSQDLPSGTDRVAEVAARMPDVPIFVNLQGDEPEVSGQAIDRCIELLEQDGEAVMATLATPIRSLTPLHDPACVKVVMDAQGRALYFSRSVIPHPRQWSDRLLEAEPPVYYQHLGLYAYRREFLLEFPRLPRPALEAVESLEQLRVLHAGRKIAVAVVQERTCGIDTAADYRAFVSRHLGR